MLFSEALYSDMFDSCFSRICENCNCSSDECELDPDKCRFDDRMELLQKLCFEAETLANEIELDAMKSSRLSDWELDCLAQGV